MTPAIEKHDNGLWIMSVPYDMNDVSWSRSNGQLVNIHDHRVKVIQDELLYSNYTMYYRVSYSVWHWYDESEMNRFFIYVVMKHADIWSWSAI